MQLKQESTVAEDFLGYVPSHLLQPWMSQPQSLVEFERAMKRMPPRNSLVLTTSHTNWFSMVAFRWRAACLVSSWECGKVSKFRKSQRRRCYRLLQERRSKSPWKLSWHFSFLEAGKIFARILFKRLQVVAEETLRESQYGFRRTRGTINMIFYARQIQEKNREKQKPLLFVFYDMEKAFGKVPGTAMYWSSEDWNVQII